MDAKDQVPTGLSPAIIEAAEKLAAREIEEWLVEYPPPTRREPPWDRFTNPEQLRWWLFDREKAERDHVWHTENFRKRLIAEYLKGFQESYIKSVDIVRWRLNVALGIEIAKQDTARKMLALGFSVDVISQVTEMDPGEISEFASRKSAALECGPAAGLGHEK